MDYGSTKLVAGISAWFHANDDGEFGVLPEEYASVHDRELQDATTIVYCTKAWCVARIREVEGFEGSVASIARRGLPTVSDVVCLRGSNGERRVFYGDADPVDLMVFAWLRAHTEIEWGGIGDVFLERCRVANAHSLRIPLSESEVAAMDRMQECCPDYRELIGPGCAAFLDNGYKFELEGALS